MFEEFKRFIARGNVVELAVAFILGAAVATVVTSLVNIVMSLVAAIFGASVSFDQLTFVLNGTPIPYGAFLTAVISFVIVAVVTFSIVKAYERFRPQDDPTTKPCEYCQTDIPVKAVRCPNCTSQLVMAASGG